MPIPQIAIAATLAVAAVGIIMVANRILGQTPAPIDMRRLPMNLRIPAWNRATARHDEDVAERQEQNEEGC